MKELKVGQKWAVSGGGMFSKAIYIITKIVGNNIHGKNATISDYDFKLTIGPDNYCGSRNDIYNALYIWTYLKEQDDE